MSGWSITLLILILSVSQAQSQKIFVDSSATGSNDGSSWIDAFTDFNDALVTAGQGDTICVAKGTYQPTAYPPGCSNCVTDRDFSFLLPDSAVLLGGFPSGGGPLAIRDWEMHETVLSGDIGATGMTDDNVRHILISSGSGEWTVLDGFIITKGNAEGSDQISIGGNDFNHDHGGGLYLIDSRLSIRNTRFAENVAFLQGGAIQMEGSSLTLDNVVFIENECGVAGGAIFCNQSLLEAQGCEFAANELVDIFAFAGGAIWDDGSDLLLDRCSFEDNFGGWFGGAVLSCAHSRDTFRHCFFKGNSSSIDGGAIHTSSVDSSLISNCVFIDNSCPRDGGALFINSSYIIVNNSFYRNQAGNLGGAVFQFEKVLYIANSIFWDNGDEIHQNGGTLSVEHSLVEGGFPGMGNVDADPQFADTASCDLALIAGSPAIDAGSNDTIPPGDTVDQAGKPRVVNGTVDMGAYEFQLPAGRKLFVDSSATGANTGSNWTDAFPDFQTALDSARSGDTICIAKGAYYPDTSFVIGISGTLIVTGGFPPGGSAVPDPANNPTILCGDTGTTGDSTDNAAHVVTVLAQVESVEISGCTVRNGNASGGGQPEDDKGGGVLTYGTLLLQNCVVTGNYSATGGPVYASGNQAFLHISHSRIHQNTSGDQTAFSHDFGSRVLIDNESVIAH